MIWPYVDCLCGKHLCQIDPDPDVTITMSAQPVKGAMRLRCRHCNRYWFLVTRVKLPSNPTQARALEARAIPPQRSNERWSRYSLGAR